MLELDYDREIEHVCARLKEILSRDLSRRGLVVAMSGGIDSSVSAALSVRALGKERVYGLLLPERDSSGDSVTRGRMLAEHLGIRYELFDIAPTLEAIGCYRWRDEAIRQRVPGVWRRLEEQDRDQRRARRTRQSLPARRADTGGGNPPGPARA